MKTTVEINEQLMRAVKRFAGEHNVTFRQIAETALREYLQTAQGRTRRPFRLRPCAVRGRGLQPQAAGRPWSEIRGLAYEGRGG